MIRNPFITSGYVSADYFCDRRQESERLVREVVNGNNLALVSTRRMGKTGLIRHCFQFPEIKQNYYTFFIDTYDSRSLRDFVFALSKEILEGLKPAGKKALFRYTYSEILFRLPEKQKELLIAITKEGKAKAITSGAFIKKYKLASASSVQSALKGLLEKEFVTQEMGVCQIYDRFLGIWLKENY